jgi:hypothetical protein
MMLGAEELEILGQVLVATGAERDDVVELAAERVAAALAT